MRRERASDSPVPIGARGHRTLLATQNRQLNPAASQRIPFRVCSRRPGSCGKSGEHRVNSRSFGGLQRLIKRRRFTPPCSSRGPRSGAWRPIHLEEARALLAWVEGPGLPHRGTASMWTWSNLKTRPERGCAKYAACPFHVQEGTYKDPDGRTDDAAGGDRQQQGFPAFHRVRQMLPIPLSVSAPGYSARAAERPARSGSPVFWRW